MAPLFSVSPSPCTTVVDSRKPTSTSTSVQAPFAVLKESSSKPASVPWHVFPQTTAPLVPSETNAHVLLPNAAEALAFTRKRASSSSCEPKLERPPDEPTFAIASLSNTALVPSTTGRETALAIAAFERISSTSAATPP